MNLLKKILIILIIIFCVIVGLYAFFDPARDWMQINLGPPLTQVFGGTYAAIADSWIVQQYIVPPLNMFLIAFAVGIICYHFLLRPTYVKFRTGMVQSAGRDSGLAYMTEPVSQPIVTPTPTVNVQAPPQTTPATTKPTTPQPQPKPEGSS